MPAELRSGKAIRPVRPRSSSQPRQPRSKSKFSHTYRVHAVIRASPLSKESPENNFRGFYNLAMLLLFVLNLRLIIENYLKYGILLSWKGTPFWRQGDMSWAVVSLWVSAISSLFAYIIQVFAVRRANSGSLSILNVIILSFSIIVPSFISWKYVSPSNIILVIFGTLGYLDCLFVSPQSTS
jgi:diacylglycerol O-acyltransferase-1